MTTEDFEVTVERLYAAHPDTFVADRNAAAKQARGAGEKQLADRIAALRRPSTAAALVNRFVRGRETDRLGELTELGERLRTAQRHLDVPAMKRLGGERGPLVAALAEQIARQSPEPVSAGIHEQLTQTLSAAVADKAAEQAVRSGRLVTALSYSGLGEVDLQNVVAVPPGNDTAGTDDDDADEHDAAPRTQPARPAVDDAVARRRLERAEQAQTEAQEAYAAAEHTADLARKALRAAQRTADRADERLGRADAARQDAQQAVADAAAELTSS